MLITVLPRVSLEALHDILEVRAIDAHNQRIIRKMLKEQE